MDLTTVIEKPVITEKSIKEVAEHNYTFLVDKKANKNQIAKAIGKIFKVNVLNVRTIKLSGKTKRVGKKGKVKKFSDKKKAIIKIKSDQKIDIFPEGDK